MKRPCRITIKGSRVSYPKIFCAADSDNFDTITTLASAVEQGQAGLKLGLQFFNRFGPEGVAKIQKSAPDLPIFLDLKYYDIPNTVAGAVKSVLQVVQPAFINVHASGGQEMMERAVEAADGRSKVLAVTILTSFDQQGFEKAGYAGAIAERVNALAQLAKKSGMDGVVCSPHEVALLRETCGDNFILMVPGIRPKGSAKDDQKRVMTPKDAIEAGASHLVIGRPITQAADPVAAISEIYKAL